MSKNKFKNKGRHPTCVNDGSPIKRIARFWEGGKTTFYVCPLCKELYVSVKGVEPTKLAI